MGSTPPIRRHRFTTRDYFRMAEVGILAEDRRFELIEGEIIEVSPPGNRHSSVVSRIIALLAPVAGRRAIVRVQDPVVLNDFSVPQPDIAVLRFTHDFYESAHPGPDDMLLAVEVADSSLAIDLRRKVWLYAAARVPEYWVIDLRRDRVVVHTGPEQQRYSSVRSLAGEDVLTTAALPGEQWTVAELLGRSGR
jgi:Uma2 family endonuclease